MERYNFKSVEQKWQKVWEDNKVFSTKVDKNKKTTLFIFLLYLAQIKKYYEDL